MSSLGLVSQKLRGFFGHNEQSAKGPDFWMSAAKWGETNFGEAL